MAGDNDLRNYTSLGQSLIPVVNRLQDIFAQLGSQISFHFPQVVVVGSQSSGKSSVLEALVGRKFLPRGQDICTRRPLVLELVRISRRSDEDDGDEETGEDEWGEFAHLPGLRFTDFSAIRDEIQAETEREVGVNKGISDKQIRLKIFSPYVLNINFVDLPGITKVPVGDQPLDIEDHIRAMIMSYIKHPSCIILVISPANSDLVNSDALQIARIADTDGSRTIGVITKLDITDKGTDSCNFLLGKENPLQLGYIGVVNQSQKEILANKSIRDALVYEEEFFHSHPVYNSLAGNCGIPQLAKKLDQIFEKHIKVMLSDLKAYIGVKKELTSYGEVTDSEIDDRSLLLDILRKFSDAFTSAIEGKNGEMTFELVGGARIQYIFQSVFVKRLEDVDPCEGLSDKDIQTAIQNATGFKSMLFVPEVPFEVLLRRKIALLLDPSLQCVHIIYDELVKLAHKCQTGVLLRFPELRRWLEEVVFSLLHEGLAKALKMVENLIEMEMDYINTSHPSFIGGSKAMAAAAQQQRLPETIGFNRVPGTEKILKSPSILARAGPSRFVTNQVIRQSKSRTNGYTFRQSWGISSIFELGESIEYSNSGELIPSYNAGEAIQHANEREEILSANREEAILSANGGEATMSLNGGKTILSCNTHGAMPSCNGGEAILSAIDGEANMSSNGGKTILYRNTQGAMPSCNGGEAIPSASDSDTVLFADGRNRIHYVNGVDSILFASAATEENFDPLHNVDPIYVSSVIQLKAPPAVLQPTEAQSEQISIGITATKILLRSYHDIVRKNIEDRVPKTIMHFLVNHAKRELYPTLVKQLYREDLFTEMFNEQEDVAVRRKQCKNIPEVLQQALCTLDELL